MKYKKRLLGILLGALIGALAMPLGSIINGFLAWLSHGTFYYMWDDSVNRGLYVFTTIGAIFGGLWCWNDTSPK